jgi:hypothetical protein
MGLNFEKTFLGSHLCADLRRVAQEALASGNSISAWCRAMKRLLLTLVTLGLLFIAGPCWAQIVRDVSNANFDSSGIGVTVTPASAMNLASVTVGDTIVIGASWTNIAATGTLSDTNGTPAIIINAFDTINALNVFEGWCIKNAASGTHGLQLSFNASVTFPVIWAVAFKNTDTTNPCYSSGSTGANSSMALSTGTFSANSNDMVVSFGAIAAGGSFSTGTTTLTYTMDSASPGCNCGMEYAIQPTTSASVQATFNNTVGANWGEWAIPIKSGVSTPSAPAGVAIQSMDSFVWYLLIAAVGLAHGFMLAAVKLAQKVRDDAFEHPAVYAACDLIGVGFVDRPVLVAET